MLRALIFDVDGTLAETERDAHRVAFNWAFVDAGLPWHWDIAGYGELLKVAGGRERLSHYIKSNSGKMSQEGRERLARELHARKTEHYLSMIGAGAVQMRSGVERLLEEARKAGIVLAIATTTTRANVVALLENALPPGALAWFAQIGAAEDAPRKKPDPGVYEHVLARIGLSADECLAFEDSALGLQAALGAGLGAIVTLSEYTVDQDFSGALSVLSELGEPYAPTRWIAGAALRNGYVDLAQLHEWHIAHLGLSE